MRRLIFAFVAAVSIVAITQIALAADMARPVPQAAPPPQDWSGVYVGLEGGYGWGRQSTNSTAAGNQLPAVFTLGVPAPPTVPTTLELTSPVFFPAVDTGGSVNCCDDVGFAAIGIGAWHAKSRLMQGGYINNMFFAPALAVLYAAKKAAEIAPGVGRATDIQIVLREGHFPLWDHVHKPLEGSGPHGTNRLRYTYYNRLNVLTPI
jgi:hypothetical protein